MCKYSDNLNILRNLVLDPRIHPLDYTEYLRKDELNKQFQFFQRSIKWHEEKYKINPGIFIFNNDNTINAFATQINTNLNLIGFNIGIFSWLWENFMDNSKLLDHPKLSSIKELQIPNTTPLEELAYQVCSLFIYYHETAHLMQKKQNSKSALFEDLNNCGQFDFNTHVSEIDADTYAAISVTTNIKQYFENYLKVSNPDSYDHLVAFLSACLFVFIMVFPNMNRSIFYRECSHPHPLIRILSIVYTLVEYSNVIEQKKRLIEVEADTLVIQYTLEFAEIISNQIHGPLEFNDFVITLRDNHEDINKYFQELRIAVGNDPNMATSIRNQIKTS